MWQALAKGGISRKPKILSFFMLIKSYNLSQLSAKILEGKPSTRREIGCWTGLYIQQSNWTRNWENINWISTSGIINVNVSVYLTAYSAYAIKSYSRFLTATNEVCVEFFLASRASHSLSCRNPLLHEVVNFQPEVSCRLHALFSKLCRFFFCFFLAACLKLRPFPVYCTLRTRENKK